MRDTQKKKGKEKRISVSGRTVRHEEEGKYTRWKRGDGWRKQSRKEGERKRKQERKDRENRCEEVKNFYIQRRGKYEREVRKEKEGKYIGEERLNCSLTRK